MSGDLYGDLLPRLKRSFEAIRDALPVGDLIHALAAECVKEIERVDRVAQGWRWCIHCKEMVHAPFSDGTSPPWFSVYPPHGTNSSACSAAPKIADGRVPGFHAVEAEDPS